MLQVRQSGETNVLEIELDGAMTREDFDRVTARAEEMIERFGTIRIVEIIRDIGKMEPSAIWADFKWGPKHLKNFSHAAVVADQQWVEWMAVALRRFIPVKVRCFHLDELEEARQWARTVE
jgi:hypothetical protein